MSVEVMLIASNIVMFLALVAITSVHVWTLKNQDKREDKYIQAVLSKNIQEYNRARTVVPQSEPTVPTEPPYFSETELSDKDWYKKIEDINAQSDIL